MNVAFLTRATALIRGASADLALDNATAEVVDAARAEHMAIVEAAQASADYRKASATHRAAPCPLHQHLALRAHGRMDKALEAVHLAVERRSAAEAALKVARQHPDVPL